MAEFKDQMRKIYQPAIEGKEQAEEQIKLLKSIETELHNCEHLIEKALSTFQLELRELLSQIAAQEASKKSIAQSLERLTKQLDEAEKQRQRKQGELQKKLLSAGKSTRIPIFGGLFGLLTLSGLKSLKSEIDSLTKEVDTLKVKVKEWKDDQTSSQQVLDELKRQDDMVEEPIRQCEQRRVQLNTLIAQTRSKKAFFSDLVVRTNGVLSQLDKAENSARDIKDVLDYLSSPESNIRDLHDHTDVFIHFVKAIDKLMVLLHEHPDESVYFERDSTWLKVFENRHQKAFLVPTCKGVRYVLEEHGNPSIVWSVRTSDKPAVSVKGKSKYEAYGLFNIGKRTNWLYSKKLYTDPGDLELDIKFMVTPEDALQAMAYITSQDVGKKMSEPST
ncbi:TPA: hypothetical protein I6Z12_001711 [Vibrio cholerae]|nr:hypothetical protein [Vibrio cholerae]